MPSSNLEKALEGFREILPGHALVDAKHPLVGKRMEILFRRPDPAAEPKAKAGPVESSPPNASA
ncbi:hypothetical protein, partial [Agrobacterium fabrum]|uniref:hypothetical protein n=1 Tax=Agrobacterium fabrum TaxID=1176649 RepID=UPI001AEF0FAD